MIMLCEITYPDYLMGREKNYLLTSDVVQNAPILLEKVNKLLAYAVECGITLYTNPIWKSLVSSGWRPKELNAATPNAAPRSKHITGHAVDVYDPEGSIDNWLTDDILRQFDLWREHPSQTKSWCHLQDIPPGEGTRVEPRTFYA